MYQYRKKNDMPSGTVLITLVFLMKEKSEVSQIFKNFNKMLQTQFEIKINILRTDNDGEFFNSILGK